MFREVEAQHTCRCEKSHNKEQKSLLRVLGSRGLGVSVSRCLGGSGLRGSGAGGMGCLISNLLAGWEDLLGT